MGWCQEFGAEVRAGCGHAMTARPSSCACPECGAVCEGKFAGCAVVWANGPRLSSVHRPPTAARRSAEGGEKAEMPSRPGRRNQQPAAALVSPEVLTSPGDTVAALAEMRDVLARQQALLEGTIRAEEAAGRMGALVEDLPARLGAVMRDALRPPSSGQRPADALARLWPGWRASDGPSPAQAAEVMAQLQKSLLAVQESGAALRSEVARLAALREAFSDNQLAAAKAVEEATGRTAERLSAIAKSLDTESNGAHTRRRRPEDARDP